MNYLKQVSYIELKKGFQTYIFNTNLEPIRYKFFFTRVELNDALEKARNQGWTVINATKVVARLSRQTKR